MINREGMPTVLLALLAVTTGCGGGSGIGGMNVGDIEPPIELDDPDPGGI